MYLWLKLPDGGALRCGATRRHAVTNCLPLRDSVADVEDGIGNRGMRGRISLKISKHLECLEIEILFYGLLKNDKDL